MSFESYTFAKREITLGPEDPEVILNDIITILGEKKWMLSVAQALTGILSLLMALFLVSVFFWRRSLVNRVSLRLIFAISVCDFAQCLASAASRTSQSLEACLASAFFIYTSYRTGIYLSSAVAFNLQMVFHRKSQTPLPRYVEYLYYIIPFTVASIHTLVYVAISSSKGVCDMFNLVPNGTTAYIVYVIFQCLLIPSIFVFYNIIASTSVIITLYRKQRKVREALESASSSTREFLITKNDSQGPIPRTISAKEAEQLKAAQMVYRACIRIALYPLAPIVWWIFIATFYIVQYPVTMTYKSDIQKMVRITYLTWFAYPAMAFINFLVFVTDPAVTKVISEVRKGIRRELAARQIHATSSHDTLDGSEYSITKLPKMVLSESFGSGTTHDNASTASAEKQYLGSNTSADNFSSLEDGQSISTSILDMYNDKVVRRIRAGGDADSFMNTL